MGNVKTLRIIFDQLNMKNLHYTSIFLILALFSCKKYQNDSFYSTYTPEGRLTKGGVWVCTKILKNNGAEFLLNDFQYNFDFSPNGSITMNFGMLDASLVEHDSLSDWSFSDNKTHLNFMGKWKIQKLTVNQMELIDELGCTYFFDKKSTYNTTNGSPIDVNLIGAPLYGVHQKVSSLINYKNCEQISEISGTSTTSPLTAISGVSGIAIGGNASTLGSYNFQQNFTKIGKTTFWLKGPSPSAIEDYSNIKINGQSCSFKIVEWGNDWYLISIEIQTPGLKQFSIPTVSPINGTNYLLIEGIDEIRFWEYE